MSETLQQQEAMFVTELPPVPAPPVDIYLVLAFYVGPGRPMKTWKIFPKQYTTESAARAFAESLTTNYRHRTIYRLLHP